MHSVETRNEICQYINRNSAYAQGDAATAAGAGHRGKGDPVKGLAAPTAPASPAAGRLGKGTGKMALASPRVAGGARRQDAATGDERRAARRAAKPPPPMRDETQYVRDM